MKMNRIKFLLSSVVMASSLAATAGAATTSYNSGSLGSAGDGVNSDTVTLATASPLAASGDTGAGYAGGARTQVAYQAALNPSSSSPFSIEFWANPSASDGDDTAVNNRYATGNRSGWSIFQRGAAVGWNIKMYNGTGGDVGWDLAGGTATLGAWSHVVATWSGSAALLYVNGALVDSVNDTLATPGYNANPSTNSPSLNVGANFNGGSPSTSLIDEVAFYGSELSLGQISNHYALAASTTAGAYSSAVMGDGAVLYLQNIPEPSSALLMGLGALGLMRRSRR